MKRRMFSLLIVLSLLAPAFAQSNDEDQKTYILLRLDDMGMCHSLNLAIAEVIESGLPISTSVMFACPWYQEAVDILKKHPETGVGIHLTLNAEWKNYRWGPVVGREAVPSLVDSNGYFFPSRSKLFANNPKMEEIEKELRAQIERAVNSGIRIDYIDYHMGAAVQTPELRELVKSLANEYGLGMSGYFGESYSNVTYHAGLGDKTDSLLAVVSRLKPGLNLQVVHVGLDTPEMQALLDMNEFGLKQMSVHRYQELQSIMDPAFRRLLEEKDIVPITYRQLIEMVGLEGMDEKKENPY